MSAGRMGTNKLRVPLLLKYVNKLLLLLSEVDALRAAMETCTENQKTNHSSLQPSVAHISAGDLSSLSRLSNEKVIG